MIKQQELVRLRKFAEQYPADSYLGPWLNSVIAEVERDVQCDLIPSVLPSDARKRADEILAEARATGKEIRDSADKYAEAIKEGARKDRAGIVDSANAKVSHAIRELTKLL